MAQFNWAGMNPAGENPQYKFVFNQPFGSHRIGMDQSFLPSWATSTIFGGKGARKIKRALEDGNLPGGLMDAAVAKRGKNAV